MESYQRYKQASALQKEANILLNKLELLADHGVKRAELLIDCLAPLPAQNLYNQSSCTKPLGRL